ncbi:hypothetical protein, partial [Lutibacter sp.]|uniref:hypothetical protein n=1 Tax=Lutibacter sp. TaxID=1925666 RepID=UPI0035691289
SLLSQIGLKIVAFTIEMVSISTAIYILIHLYENSSELVLSFKIMDAWCDLFSYPKKFPILVKLQNINFF